MTGDAQANAPGAGVGSNLAAQLAPALNEACRGRLGEIRWFRSDWQRGGASTGYTTFRFDDGPREVVLKLPVGPEEHRFTTGLAETDAPTPRIAASGREVGGYDLAWLVVERLPGSPLTADCTAKTVREVVEAAARFQQRAGERWPTPPAHDPTDWEALLAQARQAVKDNPIPDQQRWNEAIKKTQRAVAALLRVWNARPVTAWCHGDLHLGNAMRRPDGSPWGEGGCVLLDLAEAHPGHWCEDAVYLERTHWGRDDAVIKSKPVALLAKARKRLGFENGEDYNDIADVRRVLTAACAPAFLHREGAPAYLAAALAVIDRTLPRFGR